MGHSERKDQGIYFKAVIPQYDNPPSRDLCNSSYHTTAEDNILLLNFAHSTSSTNRHLSLTFAFHSVRNTVTFVFATTE